MTNTELERCIRTYGKELYSFCRSLTHSVQEADDLYQDTFLKAMELEQKIDCGQNPKSYLLSVAVRLWKNRRRKYAWRRRICEERVYAQEVSGQEWADEEQSPEEWLLAREEAAAVRQAVERLPERQRVIVLLYYMEELSVAQIAGVVKIPEGTVKSRLYQARKSLQRELEDILYEERFG